MRMRTDNACVTTSKAFKLPQVFALSARSLMSACRREFWSCFALQDQKEGMAAFVEKRKPVFQDK